MHQFVTVTLRVAVLPSARIVIIAVPALRAVTRPPDADTMATAVMFDEYVTGAVAPAGLSIGYI